jgi:hypothetical protein
MAWGAQAWAEVPVRVTQTLTLESRIDNQNGVEGDDDYSVILNRTNLSASVDDLSGSLRLDGMGFYEPPSVPGTPSGAPCRFCDDLRLERLTVEYGLGDLALLGGDFYLQLGRGIGLSVRKVNELAFDLAIRGGRASWTGEAQRVEVFGGRINPANIDNVSQRFIEDPEDIVAGTSYELSSWDAATFGLYGVYLQPQERLLPQERDLTYVGGLTFDAPGLADWLTLYLEGDAQARTRAGVDDEGFAAYGAANVQLGDTGLLLEGLLLDSFEMFGGTNTAQGTRFAYNLPPTLERIDQEVLNSRDVQGARARLEHLFLDGSLLVYANAMLRQTDPGQANEVDQVHGYGGFELTYQEGSSRVFGSGGYRREEFLGQEFKTLRHAELDWVQHLGGPYSLHVMSLNDFRTLYADHFRRGSTFAGIEHADLGSVTFEYGYDTQNEGEGVAQSFYAGILAWKFDQAWELRTTAGTQRGGLKCIAGVCRIFPSFAGARAELIGHF